MKIGELVKHYAPIILAHCKDIDHAEFERLRDRAYSKRELDLNYPFCKSVAEIFPPESMRYYSKVHNLRGASVRVTSQWFEPPTSRSRTLLVKYLKRLGIEVIEAAGVPPSPPVAAPAVEPARASKGRFKGSPIQNAQSLLVRNILSNLGSESFSDKDWRAVIEAFDKRCAYCGEQARELMIDHVTPINRRSLGEHRLGNLVPSCRACNTAKADRHFHDFLSTRPDRIKAIEDHIERHGYKPITHDARIRRLVELAHDEVARVAERYISIINLLIADS